MYTNGHIKILNPLGLLDPLKFKHAFWPDVTFYRKQVDILYSIVENAETIVVAGNKLGKDFVAGFICPWFFCSAIKLNKTCRIVTTSVAERHLKVLWGEIGRFIVTAKPPLLYKQGGPLIMNHMAIYRASEQGSKNPVNYLIGKVCEKDEGFSGHHADLTLAVIDEASGIADGVYQHMAEWAKRILMFGNPNQCENIFKEAIRKGDICEPDTASK